MDNYMDYDFESSDEENSYNDDEDTEPDYGIFVEEDTNQSQKSYVVLKEEDIRKHQKEDIERVSMVLSLSQVEAIVLLLHFQWSVSKVEDEWFTDEERIRKTVGLMKEPVVDVNGREGNIQCGICFDSYALEEIARVSCGHPYCITCWTGYVSSKINDGPECLRVKCPEPSCSAAVDQDLIDKVSEGEEKEKYYRYFLRSYVEENKNKFKWCPSPGCVYAIEFGDGNGSRSSNYDVSCLCSNKFCWNCCEDAHSPVDCDTVAKWIFRNQDDSENKNWILVNSKGCPKCKRPIEKNEGCNHMTCKAPCGHHFCWVCLSPLKGHKPCNKFVDKDKTKKKEAKLAIDKYMHYYGRWGNNQSSKLKAMKYLEELQSVQLKKLSTKLSTSETQLQFTVEAWIQIIECRRVLKWTYAYGYYLPNDSHQEQVKKQLFEYLQGEAESGLERLHYCAEKELNQFITKTKYSFNDFDSFRTNLINLTKVTKTYFENLVEALENGLEDERYTENINSNLVYEEASSGKKRKRTARF